MIIIDKIIARGRTLVISWHPKTNPKSQIYVTHIKLTDNGVVHETVFKDLVKIYAAKNKTLKVD